MQEGPQRERGNVRDGGTASRPLTAAEANAHRTEKASRSMVPATGGKARLASIDYTCWALHNSRGKSPQRQWRAWQALELCALEHVLWESPKLGVRKAPASLTREVQQQEVWESVISASWDPRGEFSMFPYDL